MSKHASKLSELSSKHSARCTASQIHEMRFFPFFVLSSAAFLFVGAVSPLTSDGCIDPSGFDNCNSVVDTEEQQCYQQNCGCADAENCSPADPSCVTNCRATAYQGWINCAMQSCWNRVSCGPDHLPDRSVNHVSFVGRRLRVPDSSPQRRASARLLAWLERPSLFDSDCRYTGRLFVSARDGF